MRKRVTMLSAILAVLSCSLLLNCGTEAEEEGERDTSSASDQESSNWLVLLTLKIIGDTPADTKDQVGQWARAQGLPKMMRYKDHAAIERLLIAHSNISYADAITFRFSFAWAFLGSSKETETCQKFSDTMNCQWRFKLWSPTYYTDIQNKLETLKNSYPGLMTPNIDTMLAQPNNYNYVMLELEPDSPFNNHNEALTKANELKKQFPDIILSADAGRWEEVEVSP